MKVIGLDLSLTAPALSITDMVPLGLTLRTDAKRGDKRFCDIRDWLAAHVGQHRPRLALVEAVPPYDHASSGLERVHGVAREVLARYDVPFAYANVSAVKAYATGDGRADKVKVMAEVERETGWAPPDDNASDAYVLRWMGEDAQHGVLLGALLTPAALQALSSIEWPMLPGVPYLPEPYGKIRRARPKRAMCRHGVVCLLNGDSWIHPFTLAVCDKPPKPKR